ncbi:MAG: hypothetical protein K0Q87_397 [Neobacillus sp.]|jgi:hypothetical protein|nr:hypothetical protein [Neobacillus sp.]
MHESISPLLTQDDLMVMFSCGKTKLQAMLNANVLPVVKVGRKYYTTQDEICKWVEKNRGKEIRY